MKRLFHFACLIAGGASAGAGRDAIGGPRVHGEATRPTAIIGDNIVLLFEGEAPVISSKPGPQQPHATNGSNHSAQNAAAPPGAMKQNAMIANNIFDNGMPANAPTSNHFQSGSLSPTVQAVHAGNTPAAQPRLAPMSAPNVMIRPSVPETTRQTLQTSSQPFSAQLLRETSHDEDRGRSFTSSNLLKAKNRPGEKTSPLKEAVNAFATTFLENALNKKDFRQHSSPLPAPRALQANSAVPIWTMSPLDVLSAMTAPIAQNPLTAALANPLSTPWRRIAQRDADPLLLPRELFDEMRKAAGLSPHLPVSSLELAASSPHQRRYLRRDDETWLNTVTQGLRINVEKAFGSVEKAGQTDSLEPRQYNRSASGRPYARTI